MAYGIVNVSNSTTLDLADVNKNVAANTENISTLQTDLASLQDSVDGKVSKSGDTMTGTLVVPKIESATETTTWLAGNQGTALVNSTASAGTYVALTKSNSTNGYFTTANWNSGFYLNYTAKDTVDAETNSTTKSAILLNESGDMSIPGNITASGVLTGTTAMTLSAGRVSGLSAGQTRVYGNGVAISNPATANDVGFIRVTGTGESDTVLEIATGDDSGTGEQIVCRQYSTSNTVAHELTLMNADGDTVTAGNIIYKSETQDISRTMITWVEPASTDLYGCGIGIGGGGLTVIGGGKSTATVLGSVTDGGQESMIIANDNQIDIYDGVNSGLSSGTHTTISGGDFSGRAQDLRYHSSISLEAASTAGDAGNNVFVKQGLGCGAIYNNSNAPCQYGNIITIHGEGAGQLVLGWSGTDNTTEHLYYRSHRDTTTGGYGPWRTIPYYEASTTDLTAGSSTLATDLIYLVYE